MVLDTNARNHLDVSTESVEFSHELKLSDQVRYIRPRNFHWLHRVYNITAAKGNNYFAFSDGANPHTCTVPDGNYSFTTLAAYLNTLANWTYGATNVTSISLTQNAQSELVTLAVTASVGTPLFNPTDGWAYLGITQATISALPVTASRHMDLVALRSIYICAPWLRSRNHHAGSGSNPLRHAIAHIPVEVGFGGHLVHHFEENTMPIPVNDHLPPTSNWELRDEQGQLIPAQHGRWVLDLALSLA